MNQPETINPTIEQWLSHFSDTLQNGDHKQAAGLFAENGMWRDLLAFTWTIRTLEGRKDVLRMLESRLEDVQPTRLTIDELVGEDEAWLKFSTRYGEGKGYLRLRDGKALTLFTALQDLAAFPQPVGSNRPTGLYQDGDKRNWLARTQLEKAAIGKDIQPYVLIVGGGQGGLALGAQLKVQGVPFLIVDRLDKPGDQWRSRYDSLTLHDPVWYDHMPFIPFPKSWPIYTPKDQLGDFLEAYTKIMDLNIWCGTEFASASRNEETENWTVTLDRGGEKTVIRPTHIVMAVGNAGFPKIPVFPDAASFKGPQIHSSEYTNGCQFAGQKVVVVGANNSAHDICADLVAHDIRPVMIQRSSTLVLRGKTNTEMARTLYSEEALGSGLTTEKADFLNASVPMRMSEEHQKTIWSQVRKNDSEFYNELTAAGFQLDFGEDGTGLFMKYLRTASGYYIDVGASAMIADGRIELRSGSGVEKLTADGLVLTDGSKVEADAVIYATGFGSMEEWVKRLISPAVAEKIGRCWGYGSGTSGDPGPWEGELRNMWKPTAQKGLWFHGGNLQQSRFYSHYLALQLKARWRDVLFD